jgi:hypothetical protein
MPERQRALVKRYVKCKTNRGDGITTPIGHTVHWVNPAHVCARESVTKGKT